MNGSKLIEADYRDMSTVIGCGGVTSTVEDLFWMKASSVELTFVRGREGSVKYLILHQGGQHLIGTKIVRR